MHQATTSRLPAKAALATLMLLLFFSLPSLAADFVVKPRITAKTQYNDNVNERHHGDGDVVAIVKPGISATYDHSRVFFDLSYDFEYKDFTQGNRGDERNHNLNTRLDVEAIKDVFFIEVSDRYGKQYQDVTRGDYQTGDTSVETVDQNFFTLKPYFSLPVQERTTLEFGGKYEDIWYSNDASVDKRNYQVFTDLMHELSANWSISGSLQYEKQVPRDDADKGGFNRYTAAAGTKYSYAEGSEIDFRLGVARTSFRDDTGSTKTQLPWQLTWTHAMDHGWTSTVRSAFEFKEDPNQSKTRDEQTYSARLDKDYGRGTLGFGLSYNVYDSGDGSGQVTKWVPSAGGVHDLTDRLAFTYDVSADIQDSPGFSLRWLVLTGLEYELSEHASAELTYRYKSYDARGIASDYQANTIGVGLTWSF